MYKGKRFFSYLLSCTILSASMALLPFHEASASTATWRLAGQDRYGTAIAISRDGWATSENVVLATGEDFPDALSAAPLANQLKAPILLTGNSVLSSELEAELDRLHVKNVFIVGGEGVVSKNIKDKLEQKKLTVKRLSGEDRYGTSLAVAEYIADSLKASKEIVVATGSDFPDALSIAPIAAKKGVPIILTEKDKLPDSVRKYIENEAVTKAYVIGGTGVISDRIKQELPGGERVSGADRYETNVAIINKFGDELNFDEVYMATGEDFPDALAGSALATKSSSPIILVNNNLLSATKNFMFEKLPSIRSVKVLGGEGAVSYATLQKAVINNVRGNSTGNIANGGIAAIDKDVVFYINDTLDRVMADGTGRVKVNEDGAAFINIKDGWVYYTNATGEGQGSIYKVKTDGSERIRLNNEPSFFLNVVGDWIYYQNVSEEGQGSIYKVKADGTGRTKLNWEPSYYVNVVDDWIYYIGMTEDGQGRIYKMRTDGTGRTQLTGDSAAFFNVVGDWVYYVNVSDYAKIYKIKADGTGRTSLNESALYINVSEDWIYFNNPSDENKLYKMRTDGTGAVKLSDDIPVLINVVGDWVYYASGTDTVEVLYRIKTDGTSKQIVE